MFLSFIACGIFVVLVIGKALFKKGMPVKRSGAFLGASFVLLIVSGIAFGSVAETDEPEKQAVKSESAAEEKQQEEVKKEQEEAKKDQEKATEKAEEETKEEKKTATVAVPSSKQTTAKNSASGKNTTSDTASKSVETSGTTEQIPVTLVKTIDGDTIKIRYEGKEQNVRYLLIDTPETSHPRLGKQPFGEEAKNRNKQLVNSGKLTIEFDVGERVDKYGRLLAYIYVDGKSVQQTLLEEGLARVAYVYPPNTRHLTPYEEAQERAKAKKIGIWSIEDYATDSGFNGSVAPKSESTSSTSQTTPTPAPAPKAVTPAPAPAAKAPAPVVEAAPAAPETEYFQNCTELRKKYPNGVPAGHPAYQPKMDRDKDNYACER